MACLRIVNIPTNLPFVTTSLTITNTGITKVRAADLQPLKRLRHLSLPNNKISAIESGAFDDLHRLEYFDISANLVFEKNRISFLEKGAFQGLSSLETVNLANNQASYLPGNIFAGFKNLSKVSLDNNPWACDCLMKDFAQWLNTSSPTLAIEVKCRSPSKHFGKKLRDLSVDELTCDDCKPQTSAPKIDQSGGQVQGSVGKDAILTCNVTACPQAEIFWTIPQSPGVELSKYSYQYSRFHVDNKNGTLTVRSTLASDAGDYHCKAFNGLGTDSKVVKLTVMES
ncbi:leucine-rich repeat and immunoglobulin-like domain-containing nogo receptor-interacting protein 3 [Branchiostoma floridae]|uniref:Leucine-rich repeat and immunoglobulin-like domain-containing nogo receptor-interacting protein 3 n=1 Tax=Branchiostoma floridae TaxID=7739 RepID=A0A9J7HQE2_BRAFL|nr:leucine-rich repeat and immunoglobulin-like domain-containing nogo receptor-interacting protein 3 [Branchiostoma floridae]